MKSRKSRPQNDERVASALGSSRFDRRRRADAGPRERSLARAGASPKAAETHRRPQPSSAAVIPLDSPAAAAGTIQQAAPAPARALRAPPKALNHAALLATRHDLPPPRHNPAAIVVDHDGRPRRPPAQCLRTNDSHD